MGDAYLLKYFVTFSFPKNLIAFAEQNLLGNDPQWQNDLDGSLEKRLTQQVIMIYIPSDQISEPLLIRSKPYDAKEVALLDFPPEILRDTLESKYAVLLGQDASSLWNERLAEFKDRPGTTLSKIEAPANLVDWILKLYAVQNPPDCVKDILK